MARKLNLEAHVVLLMSHMATPEQLAEAASQIQDNGATSIGIMDSAGTLLPDDVKERVSAIRNTVKIDVSFHGHNNLGMAVANSVAARVSGTSIIDACARGFGAGAGNTQLEAVVAVLTRMGYETCIDIKRLLVAVDIAQQPLMDYPPIIDSSSLASGIAGVFSGFVPRVRLEASEFNVSEWDIYTRLGKLQIVAGQEDVIRGIAKELSNTR